MRLAPSRAEKSSFPLHSDTVISPLFPGISRRVRLTRDGELIHKHRLIAWSKRRKRRPTNEELQKLDEYFRVRDGHRCTSYQCDPSCGSRSTRQHDTRRLKGRLDQAPEPCRRYELLLTRDRFDDCS
jgi:hypothetical protein